MVAMNAYGGLGPMVNAVLWVQVVIGAIFVGLRLYTRKVILNNVGWDDYLAIASLVSNSTRTLRVFESSRDNICTKANILQIVQIVYTACTHVATGYGLGKLFVEVGDPLTYFKAVKWETIGQCFGIACIGIGKCSVAVFLLRIVRNKIQIYIIWFFVVATTLITLFSSIVVIVQCVPVERTWNQTVDGVCWLDFAKLGLAIGCKCWQSRPPY